MNLKQTLKVGFLALLSMSLGFSATTATAQSYPNKPIRIIAGYPAGGGTDVQARLIAQKLSENWGQPVLVENLAGGLGTISIRAATRAAPDGYTIYMGASDHLILVSSLYSDLSFDTMRDFIPVSPVANQPIVLVVNPSIPARSVKELIALAQSKPGEITFASVGNGSISHLGGELLQLTTGIKLLHIPYKGSAPAVTDLLSGQGGVMMFASLATVAPHIKAGRLRALAIASESRSSTLPDVPTTAEAGLPGFLMFTWNGIFLPSGTPKEIVTKLNTELIRILGSADVRARLVSLGFEPTGSTPQEFSNFVAADLQKWGKIIKDSGIQKLQFSASKPPQ
jgi:tripartite-type tricarboxylate transporter receptor subunit TctC